MQGNPFLIPALEMTHLVHFKHLFWEPVPQIVVGWQRRPWQSRDEELQSWKYEEKVQGFQQQKGKSEWGHNKNCCWAIGLWPLCKNRTNPADFSRRFSFNIFIFSNWKAKLYSHDMNNKLGYIISYLIAAFKKPCFERWNGACQLPRQWFDGIGQIYVRDMAKQCKDMDLNQWFSPCLSSFRSSNIDMGFIPGPEPITTLNE